MDAPAIDRLLGERHRELGNPHHRRHRVKTEKPRNEATKTRHERQLARLEILLDVVFGVVIVMIVSGMPLPKDDGWAGDSAWLFLVEQTDDLGSVFIGLILITIYWLQNNTLIDYLVRTDTPHTLLSLGQMALLLAYLYSVGIGIDLDQETGTLVMQSVTLGLMGATAFLIWWYASTDRRLLSDELTAEEIIESRVRLLPEPVTAALTIPFAFLGSGWWELSWLLYLPIAYILKRLAKTRQSRSETPA